MDITCPKCGEPWDLDSLHEEVNARSPETTPWIVEGRHDQSLYRTAYEEVAADFRTRGCRAMTGSEGSHNPQTLGSETAVLSQAVMDLLGDAMDGIAAALADLDQPDD